MKHHLLKHYRVNSKKIIVIPHGTYNFRINYNNDCHYINSKKVTYILTFGILRPDKGVETIINALNRLLSTFDNVKLIIAGACDSKVYSYCIPYFRKIMYLIKKLNLRNNVVLKLNLPWKEILNLYKISDIIVLNYNDKMVLAASGPLSLAISFEKPVILTKIPRFIEFKRYLPMINPDSEEELVFSLRELISNQMYLNKVIQNIRLMKRESSWRNIALIHLQIYYQLYPKLNGLDGIRNNI